MAVELPMRNDSPHFSFQIELEGTTFGFEFRWNERDSSWYWTLLDAEDVVLLAGMRVVPRALYLWRYRYLGLPRGEVEFIDTTDADEPPGLTDLGTRVLCLYTPSTEFPEGFAT